MERRFICILKVDSRRQTTESNILDIMTLFLTKLEKVSRIHLDFATFLQENMYQYY